MEWVGGQGQTLWACRVGQANIHCTLNF
jgi:hypothetical protein